MVINSSKTCKSGSLAILWQVVCLISWVDTMHQRRIADVCGTSNWKKKFPEPKYQLSWRWGTCLLVADIYAICKVYVIALVSFHPDMWSKEWMNVFKCSASSPIKDYLNVTWMSLKWWAAFLLQSMQHGGFSQSDRQDQQSHSLFRQTGNTLDQRLATIWLASQMCVFWHWLADKW